MSWEELGKSKVSIDQSNPGISNAVALTGSIPAGTNLIGKTVPVDADGDEKFTSGNPAVVTLTGSIESLTTDPVTGIKTVTATAAEIFAGSSAKANRRKLVVKNEDKILRFRIGASSVTQQNGFPVEPGAIVEIQFDPGTAVAIYGISEGASLSAAVMEV